MAHLVDFPDPQQKSYGLCPRSQNQLEAPFTGRRVSVSANGGQRRDHRGRRGIRVQGRRQEWHRVGSEERGGRQDRRLDRGRRRRCQRRSGSARACACAASTTVDSLGAGRRRAHRSQPLPAMLPLLISPICATVELTTTLFGQCGACRLNSIDAEGNSRTGAAKFRFKRSMEGLTTTHNWVRRAHLN
jgi:hypothetical protein